MAVITIATLTPRYQTHCLTAHTIYFTFVWLRGKQFCCIVFQKTKLKMSTKTNNKSLDKSISSLLIKLITGMEIIYNQKHPDYSNKTKRGKVWKSITNVINESFHCGWSKCISSCFRSSHRICLAPSPNNQVES